MEKLLQEIKIRAKGSFRRKRKRSKRIKSWRENESTENMNEPVQQIAAEEIQPSRGYESTGQMNELLREINAKIVESSRGLPITEPSHENRQVEPVNENRISGNLYGDGYIVNSNGMASSETAAEQEQQRQIMQTTNALGSLPVCELRHWLDYTKSNSKELVVVMDPAKGQWTKLASKSETPATEYLTAPAKSLMPDNRRTKPPVTPTATFSPFLESRR